MMLFAYWTAWSFSLWMLVYINTSWLEGRTLTAAHSKTLSGDSDLEVTQQRHISGDDGTDRHTVEKKIQQLSTTRRASSTVTRKQFHVAAVAVFLPGLLTDVNMLQVAVSCSLVVFVMLEVHAAEFVSSVYSLW